MDSQQVKDIFTILHDVCHGQHKLWNQLTDTSQNISHQKRRFKKFLDFGERVEKKLEEYSQSLTDVRELILILLDKVNNRTTEEVVHTRNKKSIAKLPNGENKKRRKKRHSSSSSNSDISKKEQNKTEDKSNGDNENEFDSLAFPVDNIKSEEKLSVLDSGFSNQESIHKDFFDMGDLETDGGISTYVPNNLDTFRVQNNAAQGPESDEDNEAASIDRETDQDMTHTTNCLKRDEFGFKQKLSSPETDNRYTLYNGQRCYDLSSVNSEKKLEDSHDTQSPIHWNFIPPYLLEHNQSVQGQYSTDECGEYGIDNFDKPKTMKQWFDYADQLASNASTRLRSGCVRRGKHGHDEILVLDCSERMRGEKFDRIKSAAIEFINGIQEVKENRGLEDNIGLAIFGGHSTLLLESTSDYDTVKATIDSLKPGGDAPLHGGLLMGFAGVVGGATSRILQNDVLGHMIVFTDGSSDKELSDLTESKTNPSYFTGDFRMESEGVIEKLVAHSVKVFYVPVGDNTENKIMEQAVKETRGKVIPPTELYRLVKMTQVLILAVQVATELREDRRHLDSSVIRKRIVEKSGNSDVANDDCVDLVSEFIDPLLTDRQKGMFCELSYRSLALGDRVRRGANWIYGNQDSNLPGTVVGRDKKGRIWVEWDSGDINCYQYDEFGIRSIRRVDEPRDMSSGFIQTGFRVVRGPAWCYGDDDGRYGVGTVLSTKLEGFAIVRWDCSLSGLYRTGLGEDCEVQISYQHHNFGGKSPESTYLKPSTHLQTKTYIPKTELVKTNDEELWSKVEENVKRSANNTDKNKTDKYEHAIIIWEYKTDEGWNKFSNDVIDKLEKASKKKSTTIIVENNKKFTMDFKSMVCVDVMTKDKMEVRRKGISQ